MAAVVVLAGLAVPAGAGDAPAPADGLTAELAIVLAGALPRVGKDGTASAADLELYPTCVAGAWEKDLVGWAQFLDLENQRLAWTARAKPTSFNAMDHEGSIVRAEVAGDDIRIEQAMVINADPWVPGGTATYAIELKRAGDRVTGTFTGSFRGQPAKGAVSGVLRPGRWPAAVPGHVPLKPGEHPRMAFRAGDLPALRERARTPAGQAMLARLEAQLAEPFTLWHASGHALLWRLRGDQKHADEARRHVEMARAGKPQKDNRYGYVAPGGKLRAGPSYAGIALAYDLCYDAWDEDYRRGLAKEIQDKVVSSTGGRDLLLNTGGGQHHPQSNHYMAWNGGGAAALIGVMGDPGTDDALIARALRIFERRGRRSLEVGHGDAGYFFEGHHCGRLNNNTGFFEFLQASRVARGRDLTAGLPSGQWLVTKMLYEVCRYGSNLESLQRGMYARAFGRTGMSSGGDFAHGFGVCPEAHKAALLHFCNHLLDPPGTQRYDIMSYPHRGVYAFVNWPLEVIERNPAEILPRFLHDRAANYVIARSGWQGDEDVILSLRWGEGLAAGAGLPAGTRFGGPGARIDAVTASADGREITLDAADQSCLIDVTGRSGAPVVILLAAKTAIDLPADLPLPAPAKPASPPPAAKPKPGKDDDEPDEPVERVADQPKREPARMHRASATVNKRHVAITVIAPGAAPTIATRGEGAEQVVVVGQRAYAVDATAVRAVP